MRITTKVIQNNTLSNMNINKLQQDKLNNQMTSHKKITRPSDDPVIAIRALRLRTNVSQVTQYYEKNIPDAESWMEVTDAAMASVSGVITDMIGQCEKGANEKLASTDRQTILDAMKKLRDEVYATGNADYAGRSVFTGYRTDDTLKFTKAETTKYSITEQLNKDAIDELTYVKTGDIKEVNAANYTDNGTITEQVVDEKKLHRIRLSYSDLDKVNPKIQIFKLDDITGEPQLDAEGKPIYVDLLAPAEIETMSATDNPGPYDNGFSGTHKAVLVKETGELLIADDVYNSLMNLKDVANTKTNESIFRVTYQKSNWEKDDLKPEHYFACTKTQVTALGTETLDFNADYLLGVGEKQSIEYDVGLNQTIKVNTTADEVFSHAIGRDVDDMVAAMQDVVDMEKIVADLEKIVSKAPDTISGTNTKTDKKIAQDQLDTANKALTLLKEKAQKTFERGITKMQEHLNHVNYATTKCGTSMQKLELIKNRLMSQKSNFETLQSENEDADLTEVAIQLSGAELTYEAALMAAGKVLQTSLMNYI